MAIIKTFPFTKIFNPQTGETEMLSGSASIQACLGMLISTCKGELLGDPDFGTNIKKYLANNKGHVLYELIRQDIINAVQKYEKRINITANGISFNKSYSDENVIYLTIQYENKTNGRVEETQITINGSSFSE